MKLQKIDHVGIIVNDLPAATAFFLDHGLEVKGEAKMEGEVLDKLLGLSGTKTEFVMLGFPVSVREQFFSVGRLDEI
jgi:hypothetical protein